MKYFQAGLWAALTCSTTTLAAVLKTDVAKGDAEAFVRKANNNQALNSEGSTTYDRVPLVDIPKNLMPQGRAALAANAVKLPSNGWTATADSQQPGNEASKAIDGDANTFWHTAYNGDGSGPGYPHTITVDMKQSYLINTISMQPRQDGYSNGNIGQHQLQTSQDGNTFTAPKVIGTWRDDASTKTSIFEATNARYVRLTAYTEAGARGVWASIAELGIYSTNTPAPPYNGISGGSWSPTIDFPIVPVAAAILYNSNNMLTWSSYAADTFGGPSGGKTVTSTYNYATQRVTQRLVQETGHDMFCPGINIDARGRVFVTGGNDAPKTSIYTPGSDSWATGPQMNDWRGYQATTTLSGGRTFVIGGSWSGGQGNKNGEIYSITSNTWTRIAGAQVSAMLTNDAQGVYRADNHAMLFGWKDNYVFQAGPSKRMNWFGTGNGGSTYNAGNRANDGDAMCGIAVMYDIIDPLSTNPQGKILVTGGSPNYQNSDSTANAQIVTIGAPNTPAQSRSFSGMYFQRIFHNAVVLPNGNVLIVGGQVYGQPFSDDTAQLTPEIFDAATEHFITLPPINVPRVYHSVALMLADATVFSGGGGLCGGCATNHFDGQVYSPRYLFNDDGSRATRPVITGTNSATYAPGNTITATTNGPIAKWSMIRLGSTTHTVNTDQRRIPLTATNNGNTYNMQIPNDYGVVLPGYYYLFAMNAQGTPSIGRTIQIPR